jgi:hypothetical protein
LYELAPIILQRNFILIILCTWSSPKSGFYINLTALLWRSFNLPFDLPSQRVDHSGLEICVETSQVVWYKVPTVGKEKEWPEL